MIQTYEFDIELRERITTPVDGDEIESMANRLFEAGCDDASPMTCEGVITVSFSREGTSLDSAIRSATADVRKAGYTVKQITIDAEQAESFTEVA